MSLDPESDVDGIVSRYIADAHREDDMFVESSELRSGSHRFHWRDSVKIRYTSRRWDGPNVLHLGGRRDSMGGRPHPLRDMVASILRAGSDESGATMAEIQLCDAYPELKTFAEHNRPFMDFLSCVRRGHVRTGFDDHTLVSDMFGDGYVPPGRHREYTPSMRVLSERDDHVVVIDGDGNVTSLGVCSTDTTVHRVAVYPEIGVRAWLETFVICRPLDTLPGARGIA